MMQLCITDMEREILRELRAQGPMPYAEIERVLHDWTCGGASGADIADALDSLDSLGLIRWSRDGEYEITAEGRDEL